MLPSNSKLPATWAPASCNSPSEIKPRKKASTPKAGRAGEGSGTQAHHLGHRAFAFPVPGSENLAPRRSRLIDFTKLIASASSHHSSALLFLPTPIAKFLMIPGSQRIMKWGNLAIAGTRAHVNIDCNKVPPRRNVTPRRGENLFVLPRPLKTISRELGGG